MSDGAPRYSEGYKRVVVGFLLAACAARAKEVHGMELQ